MIGRALVLHLGRTYAEHVEKRGPVGPRPCGRLQRTEPHRLSPSCNCDESTDAWSGVDFMGTDWQAVLALS